MQTAWRIAGKGIYRHDAEGSDDMPVSVSLPSVAVGEQGLIRGGGGMVVGTYQIVADRCERQHTDFGWEVGHRHLARHLVSGVQER